MRKMLLTVSLVFIAFISASQLRANNEANTLTEGVNNRSCEKTYRFFTDEDLRNVEASAKTEWGTKIVGMLKERVDERVRYGFDIPDKSTGRSQNYICPVHKKLFKFELDKPHDHYCPDCGKSYKSDFFDACWRNIYQHNMQYFIVDCGYLYLATKDKKYFDYLKEIFLEYADKYPQYPVYTKEQVAKSYYLGRMFEQWLEDAMWFSDVCPIYEIIRDGLTQQEREKIEKNLFQEAADMITARRGQHNWQAWNNAMRTSLAVTLKNDEMMDYAVNGSVGYIEEFKKMVYDDGWYKEASPGYHYFPLKALLQTANAARACGIDLYNEKLKSMLTGVVKAMYPNMTFPAHNDGGYMSDISNQDFLYEMGYSRFKDPFILQILAQVYATKDRNSALALLTNVDIKPDKTPLKQDSYLFDDTGIAILRSGDNTLVFRYGFSDGGHSHPDRLSVTLHNGEKEILTDCGTYSYAQPAYLGWQKRGLSHNLVLVDGQDMQIRGAKTAGRLLSFDPDKNGGVASAVLDNNGYPGVKLTRTVKLDRNKFIDRFEAQSEEEHTYDYVLALSDKPELGDGFVDARLEGKSPAYEFIKGVKSKIYKNGIVTFKAGTTKFEIKNTYKTPIEVFWAEAPDIMYGSSEKDTHTIKSYMLVVRTKGKNLSISSDIILGKKR
ncbi:alginate lyase family protein [Coprobacter fastidiosus]|uniref:alginate lyase family protein n=1 Tax=Coprobacter fastidiosus TaxID=1099853 RepID=UPI0026771869|nr:alginate lyase family protein [Coprobacter fastidiosus]